MSLVPGNARRRFAAPGRLFLILGLFASRGADAQTYVDQVPRGRTITTAERVEADMNSARLHLGPLRIIPMIVVDNAGYDNNVFSAPEGEPKVGDWTATAGGGGRVILPMGSKFFLRAVAIPQYIWYAQLENRRTWGGDFSGSFLALGNRLSFEATGGLHRGLSLLNSETQVLVLSTEDDALGRFEVGLTRTLSLVASADLSRYRYGQEEIGVTSLDRTDTGALAGLRLQLSPSLTVSAGAQGTRSEFVEEPEVRDNETYAFLGGVHFNGPRFYVNLAGGYRKGQPFNNSLFESYATTVGSYFVAWKAAGPFELQAFGHRRPVYSRVSFNQLFIESRYGGALVIRLGTRALLRGYYDTGTNTYPFNVLPEGNKRVDDVVEYGGRLSVRIFGTTALQAQARQGNLTPGTGVGERKVFRFTTGITFNEEFTRE
jgi:hypothetical protein